MKGIHFVSPEIRSWPRQEGADSIFAWFEIQDNGFVAIGFRIDCIESMESTHTRSLVIGRLSRRCCFQIIKTKGTINFRSRLIVMIEEFLRLLFIRLLTTKLSIIHTIIISNITTWITIWITIWIIIWLTTIILSTWTCTLRHMRTSNIQPDGRLMTLPIRHIWIIIWTITSRRKRLQNLFIYIHCDA